MGIQSNVSLQAGNNISQPKADLNPQGLKHLSTMIKPIHPDLARDLNGSQHPLNISSLNENPNNSSQGRLFPYNRGRKKLRKQKRETWDNLNQALSRSPVLNPKAARSRNFYINE